MEGGAAAGQLFGGVINLSDILFYAIALFAIAGAAGVAFSRNIVYSAFCLLAALGGVAGIYIFISADLVAVVQILVYIGGILVLILFAVMLTNRIGDTQGSNPTVSIIPGAAVFSVLLVVVVYVAAATPWGQFKGIGLPQLIPNPALEATTAKVGDSLLTEFLLPFEVASVVLLAALIGAVIIARKEMRVMQPKDDGRNTP